MKFEENNQFDHAMTKPLPTGCFKMQKDTPSLQEFNHLTENVSLKEKTSDILIADIKFDETRVNAKTVMYNNIYTPSTLWKGKMLDPWKKPTLQFLETQIKGKKEEEIWEEI